MNDVDVDAVTADQDLRGEGFGVDDLPVLGEPLAVEFANTLYRLGDGSSIDFLDTPQSVGLWFRYAPAAQGMAVPPGLSPAAVAELHGLRAAVIKLLDAVADASPVEPASVSALNAYAALAPARIELVWGSGGTSQAVTHSGRRTDVFLADLASEFIAFFAGPQRESVRRCERPGCFMLFVQQHHKRRFCHESCSHRTRQARYYSSSKAGQA